MSAMGGTACSECPVSGFCPTGASTVLPCEEGTYRSSPGGTSAESCSVAESGYFATTQSSEQVACPRGSFSASEGRGECTTCARGRYQSATGATACRTCTKGNWCTTQVQVPCTKDTYNPHDGNASRLACLPCPALPNSTTNEREGQSSISSCMCKSSYYDAVEADDVVACVTCPSGTLCGRAGHTLASLPVLPGYFRIDTRSDDVRRCPDAKSNCSDSYECLLTTSGCRGTIERTSTATSAQGRLRDEGFGNASDAMLDLDPVSNASQGCRAGLHGVYCKRCIEQEGEKVYYSRATRTEAASCKLCEGRVGKYFAVLLCGGAACLLIGVAVVAYIRTHSRVARTCGELAVYVWQTFTPHNKVKILVGFCESSGIRTRAPVPMPT